MDDQWDQFRYQNQSNAINTISTMQNRDRYYQISYRMRKVYKIKSYIKIIYEKIIYNKIEYEK